MEASHHARGLLNEVMTRSFRNYWLAYNVYDRFIVNDDLEIAVDGLCDLVRARRGG